ncbi:MAG TPA: hypothetical protein VGP27_01480 [Mycobacterium sp.]|nr:hypothetical protein [Mycobacterium sp.]
MIYVNDNYGDFAATREDIVRQALDGADPELVKSILPDQNWAFVDILLYLHGHHICVIPG